jgi:hypothetical protein
VTLGRRGEEIGFIAWSREDTNELKPDKIELEDETALLPASVPGLVFDSALAASLDDVVLE